MYVPFIGPDFVVKFRRAIPHELAVALSPFQPSSLLIAKFSLLASVVGFKNDSKEVEKKHRMGGAFLAA